MASWPMLPGTSDQRLLELMRDGEERAFEIVVIRYGASLEGYCMRLGLSESRAEDAVQQCFLSALLALRRGDEVRDLRAWLGRIAHNVAINMMRAGSAGRETVTDWSAEDRAIHIPDMDGGLAAREALAEVAALPPMQREALLQSALGGRTYGQVAASMGVSEGAVRGLLHRARASLRNAAMIFSPLPPARRLSGWLAGGSPSAGRVLEVTAPGGSSALGGTTVRALGAGFTAVVVAAGVAAAPHGSSHSRSGRPAGKAASSGQHPEAAAAETAEASVRPGGGPVSNITGNGARSSNASSWVPATAGGGTRRSPSGPGTPPSHRRAAHTAPASAEPQLPSSTSASGPAQASAVSPVPAAGSGTVTSPAPPPSEVKKPRQREGTGSDDESQREHSGSSDAEEKLREEAEEAAERAEIEAGKRPKEE